VLRGSAARFPRKAKCFPFRRCRAARRPKLHPPKILPTLLNPAPNLPPRKCPKSLPKQIYPPLLALLERRQRKSAVAVAAVVAVAIAANRLSRLAQRPALVRKSSPRHLLRRIQ